MPTYKAIERAKSQGLDLVEVSPTARPPVCKILDYGKMKYDEKKKHKENRTRQTRIVTKEITLRPRTEDHDIRFKTNNARKFLCQGNRCALIVVFRGRERTHPGIGEEMLARIVSNLGDVAEVVQPPTMEGNRMAVILGPRVGKIDEKVSHTINSLRNPARA